MNENAIVKLKNVLLSPNDNAGLEELRMNARAICGALDTDEEEQLEFSSEETAILDDNPKWTAQVYDALASGTEPIDEVNKQDQEVADAISQILKSEDEELGRSFSEALLETMPVDYSEWGHWFYDVPPVDDEVFREIMQDRTVQAGMPRTEGLARHGLTPGIIFEACDGVRMLLDRLRELSIHPERYPTTDATKDLRKVLAWTRQLQENKEPVTFDFSLEPGGVTGNEHPAVPLNLLLAEISDTPDCPPKAAEPLLRWFFKIIPYTPLLFAGYEAEPHSDFIRLTHDPLQDEQHANLFQRWSASLDYA